MAEYFILSMDRTGVEEGRLLSYSGTIKGSKLALTLKGEVDGFLMHRLLKSLEAIQSAHKKRPAPPKSKPQPKLKAKPLALPAPALALPSPEDL